MIVADTNLIAYLVLSGERSAQAEAVYRRDPEWAAPLLWRSELCNVLATYLRAGRLTLPQAWRIADTAELVVSGREYRPSASEVLRLAAASGLSAYDCEFVAVAEALGAPLVTCDRAVLAALPHVAVSPERFLERGA